MFLSFIDSFFQTTPIPSTTITGHYNWFLVALSYAIAVLASYVALEIAGYLRKPYLKSIPWLIFGGAFAMGAGIFSMHFIGMLAFIMPMQVSYDIFLTILSLIVPIVASVFALFIIKEKRITFNRLLISGIIFGLAIASMHYTGMAAMPEVQIHYLPGLFFLSILIAITASLAALWLMLLCDKATGKTQLLFTIVSALVMGVGICGMHYTGMAAAIFTPIESISPSKETSSHLLTPIGLATLIAIIASLIMIVVLVTCSFKQSILFKLFVGYAILAPLGILEAIILIENTQSQYLTISILLVSGIILFAVGISTFLSFQLSKPIIQLKNAAQEIAKGDLTKKVPVTSEDEIGQLAISFNQMVDGLIDSKKNIDLLSEMGELLPTCVTQEEIQTIFSQYGEKLLPHLSASLCIFTSSKNQLQVMAAWGKETVTQTPLFAAQDCWAIRRGTAFDVPTFSSSLRCKHIASTGGYLCIPLSAGGEILGIFSTLFGSQTPTHQEKKIISQIAGDVSLALANVRLRSSLEHLSIHDPLTGLYNRRYMEEIVAIELNRAKGKGMPLSMIMLDIDHFKKINDTFGHTAGDVILRELSHFLKQFFRSTDIICRYGGEEFLVILPETSLAFAAEQAEILRNKVKNCSVKIGEEVLNLINLSLGVAAYPENGQEAELIIKAADTALYRAKEEGRDRISVAPSISKLL